MARNTKSVVIGQQYGKLTVLAEVGKNARGTMMYLCQCSCDAKTELKVEKYPLLNGRTKSCGCLTKEVNAKLFRKSERSVNDITAGETFERLTTVHPLPPKIKNRPRWLCNCSCGNTLEADAYRLLNGGVLSCGCLQKERAGDYYRTHGGTGTPEHNVWFGIKSRCTNPNSAAYSYYGGRGITICDRWAEEGTGFANFIEDMGKRPGPKYSVERRDNERGYEPDNCFWADAKTQARNKRNNRLITIDGETKCVAEWAELYGIQSNTIFARISMGWSDEDAVKRPLRGT